MDIQIKRKGEIKFVSVSDEDYGVVKNYTWWMDKNGYAYTDRKTEGKKHKLYMHRLIMGEPEGKVIDHKDGDVGNNRRNNLRICTHKENLLNSRLSKANTSGHSNIYLFIRTGKWHLQIGRKSYGYFDNIDDAVEKYKTLDIVKSNVFQRRG